MKRTLTISLLALVVGFGIPSCNVYDAVKESAIVDLHRDPTTTTTTTTTTIIVPTTSSPPATTK